jgi:hypothetical protein
VTHPINGHGVDQVTGRGDEHVLAALSRELDRVVDVKEVSVDGDRMWILFDDADFVLRAVAGPPGTLEVQWTAAVRERPPNLGTWWTDWRSRHASTDDLVAELLRARSWIRRMLDDQPARTRAVRPASALRRRPRRDVNGQSIQMNQPDVGRPEQHRTAPLNSDGAPTSRVG